MFLLLTSYLHWHTRYGKGVVVMMCKDFLPSFSDVCSYTSPFIIPFIYFYFSLSLLYSISISTISILSLSVSIHLSLPLSPSMSLSLSLHNIHIVEGGFESTRPLPLLYAHSGSHERRLPHPHAEEVSDGIFEILPES